MNCIALVIFQPQHGLFHFYHEVAITYVSIAFPSSDAHFYFYNFILIIRMEIRQWK